MWVVTGEGKVDYLEYKTCFLLIAPITSWNLKLIVVTDRQLNMRDIKYFLYTMYLSLIRGLCMYVICNIWYIYYVWCRRIHFQPVSLNFSNCCCWDIWINLSKLRPLIHKLQQYLHTSIMFINNVCLLAAVLTYCWCVVYSEYANLAEESERGRYNKQPYRRWSEVWRIPSWAYILSSLWLPAHTHTSYMLVDNTKLLVRN